MLLSEIKVRFYGELPAEAYEEITSAFSRKNGWSLSMDAVTFRYLFNWVEIVPHREVQLAASAPAILGQPGAPKVVFTPTLLQTIITASLRPGVDRDDAQRWLGLYLDKVTGGKVLVSYATE